MFFEKLTQMLTNAFRPKPKYLTVTPVAGTGPVAALPPATMPRHVAIIMDGNGRWAKMRSLPRSAGHAAGTEALRDIIRASDDWGIEALSLYAFSTENWARSKEEVDALMGLLLKYFASEIDELDEKNVRITILGNVNGLPAPQREAVVNAMDRTRNNDGLKLNIALNYGGRAELTRAARILAQQVRDGVIDPEDIDEEMFAEELYTADSPDVDLLIRTSGEKRTSGFLPWQLTYAEFIFDDTYWPDFTRDRYMKCLREYAGRERRFGKEEAAPDPVENPAANEGKSADRPPEEARYAPAASAESEPRENIVLEVKPVIYAAAPVSEEKPVPDVEPSAPEVEGIPDAEPEAVQETDVVQDDAPAAPKTEETAASEPHAAPEATVMPDAEVAVPEATALTDAEVAVPEPETIPAAPTLEAAEMPTADASSEPDDDAIPEDFVLEIIPVIDPKPAQNRFATEKATDAAPDAEPPRTEAPASARKAKSRKPRSRTRKAKAASADNTQPSGTPKE